MDERRRRRRKKEKKKKIEDDSKIIDNNKYSVNSDNDTSWDGQYDDQTNIKTESECNDNIEQHPLLFQDNDNDYDLYDLEVIDLMIERRTRRRGRAKKDRMY